MQIQKHTHTALSIVKVQVVLQFNTEGFTVLIKPQYQIFLRAWVQLWKACPLQSWLGMSLQVKIPAQTVVSSTLCTLIKAFSTLICENLLTTSHGIHATATGALCGGTGCNYTKGFLTSKERLLFPTHSAICLYTALGLGFCK